MFLKVSYCVKIKMFFCICSKTKNIHVDSSAVAIRDSVLR